VDLFKKLLLFDVGSVMLLSMSSQVYWGLALAGRGLVTEEQIEIGDS
jgi:hypothetical protein